MDNIDDATYKLYYIVDPDIDQRDFENRMLLKMMKEKNMIGGNFKYDEDISLKQIEDYIASTYDQHYSQNKYQATEFILDSGHGEGFCVGNIMKYAQRYGKKGEHEDWERDIMKVIHYAIILLHDHRMKYNGTTTTD